jgi:hypothetical protein
MGEVLKMRGSASKRKTCLAFGLGALAVAFGIGLQIYRMQSSDENGIWGALPFDGVGYAEDSARTGKSGETSQNADSSNPILPLNASPAGADILASAGSADNRDAGQIETQATARLTDADQSAISSSGSLISLASNSTAPEEPASLVMSGGGDTGGISAVSAGLNLSSFGGTTSGGSNPSTSEIANTPFSSMPGGNSAGFNPGSSPPSPAGIINPTNGNAGNGPQSAGAPQGGAPNTSTPQANSTPNSGATPSTSGAQSGGPVVPLSPPAPASLGSSPTLTGTTPTTTASIPGQTPTNPITPLASAPNGTVMLPIPGAGCTGANCAGSNAWQFFDPAVAIGYDYQLKPTIADQPLTFGITNIMVTTKVGSGVYDLWLFDAITGQFIDSSAFSTDGQAITITADPSADPNGAFNVVQFLLGLSPQEDQELGVSNPYLGLSQFSIRGIDPSAGLDPENPNAFITGLLFAGDINGNLFITPLAVDSNTGLPVDPPPREVSLPEPTPIVLFATALAIFGLLHRRQLSANSRATRRA